MVDHCRLSPIESVTSKVMAHFAQFSVQVKAVSRLLSLREMKENLLETCFVDPVMQKLRGPVKEFTFHLNEDRFASVAQCVRGLEAVENR